ncbi:hypothetical protein NFI96_013611 [Prochilodus magdalenae]|nr:hypothetical protein NFI96_013611 [Prochilodus magdalenae]
MAIAAVFRTGRAMLLLPKLTGLVMIMLINGSGACPPEPYNLELEFESPVVKYGDPVSVNCSSSSNFTELKWVGPLEPVYGDDDIKTVTWETDSLTDWNIQPVCYMILNGVQCNRTLSLTIYKTPDRVSISTVGHNGSMIEGRQYELQCDVQGVAPVEFLTVSWYQGDTLVNHTTFNDSTKTPVNQSTTLQITPSRDDNGAQYRCEAELDLGPEGPQPPPTVTSDDFIITIQDICPVTLQPSKVVVQYKASVTANCSTSVGVMRMGWEASQEAVDRNDDVQFITWSVDRLVEWDIQPFCFINPKVGEYCKLNLIVTVYKLPEKVSISTVGHTGPMFEGRQYELLCDIQNVAPVEFLTVKWFKGDTLVSNTTFSDSTKTPVNRSTTLQITPNRNDDGAQYRCVAELDLGPDGPQPPPTVRSDLLNITVHYKPVIHCSDWFAPTNTSLSSYPHPVMSNPPATVNWYQEGTHVGLTKRLRKNDTGPFEFIATNKMGNTSCYLNITVEYPPKFRCPVLYEVQEHQPFSPNCTVRASPVADVSWSKDAKKVDPPNYLTRKDEGVYLITAQNKYGTKLHKLTVNVTYAPEIEKGEDSVEVYKGRNVTLTCTAGGKPKPEVRWSFNNQSTGGRQTTLTLTGAKIADGGVYTCTATNKIGSNKRSMLVVVKDIPDRVSISTVNHTGLMIEDDPYELVCNIQKVSPVELLTVKWYKGDTLVGTKTFTNFTQTPVNLSATLQIFPNRDDNGTQYKCVAELDLGPDGPPLTVTSDSLIITVQNICPVTLQPSKVVVHHGASATANCSTSVGVMGIGWEASQGPVDMKPDVQFITWSVDRLVEWDIQPFCFLNPKVGEQCQVDLRVTVYKAPDGVSISTVGHTGPMIEGRQYELLCDIQNVAPVEFLTVKWFKGDTLVNHTTFSDSTKTPVNPSSKLQINPIRNDDGAQYRCVAELDLGPDGPQPPPTVRSDPLQVTVYYKPVIHCSDWFAPTNTSLSSYPHPVMSNPPATVNWYQGGTHVGFTKRLRKNDTGPFEFIATNKMGNTSCHLNITVEYGPEFDCPPSYEGKEHTPFNICSVIAYPVANVIWSKNGVKVKEPLILKKSDHGSYNITAMNKHGTKFHSLTINVQYGPEIHTAKDSLEVYKSQYVNLTCTADGNPEPKIVWSFNDQSKTTGGRQTTLRITGVKFADGGVYTCNATNKIGSQTRRVSLVVKDIPDKVSISTVNHTGLMIEDDPYELMCNIQKVSPVELLTVKWYKGDTLVDTKTFTNFTQTPVNLSATLQILPNRYDDGAQYKCVAELDLGPDGPQPHLTETSEPLIITVQNICPVTLQPSKVVVQYEASATANCSTTLDVVGMGWEASQGPVDMNADVQFITWSVDRLVEWDIQPYCFINPKVGEQCKADLSVTVYKTPDGVSISTVGHTGPMIEGRQYELLCDIQNVAPVEFLTVKWFKGDTLVSNTTFSDSTKTPVNRSTTLQITPNRNDDGAQYRCVAELDLGPDGPQPHPTVSSDPLQITVHYGPEIHTAKDSLEVYEGQNVNLTCTADGNPEPKIVWSFNNQSKTTGGRQTTLRITGVKFADGGVYTCNATNKIGSQTRRVSLVVKDYKYHIIAITCVAVLTIVIISIILIIIACVKKKRSGKYDMQSNGAEMMPLKKS